MVNYGYLKHGWFTNNVGGIGGFIPPSDYPPTTNAVEVWNWGEATGNYTTEITGDVYIAGGTSPSIAYDQAGPPNTNMKSISWGNSSTNNSHHTAPGTTSGQSNGAVNTALIPGSNSFKFYFFIKSNANNDAFYNIIDYDLQESGSVFNQGYQIFVSTAGLFAPASLVFIAKDSNAVFPQFHAKTGGTTLFEDEEWHLVEMIFDRTKALPTFKIDGGELSVINTFGGPAVSAMGSITPTNGIRFAQKEFSEATTGKANIQMAAAVYTTNLSYAWE